MNRRGFLVRAGGALAAVAAASSVATQADERSDSFEFKGYRVRWSGWKEPVNQQIVFGYWSALSGYEQFRYATTMGGVRDHRARELEVLDMQWNPNEWPSPHALVYASPAKRDEVKRRALGALLAEIA